MSAKEDFGIVNVLHLVVVDSHQSHLLQALALLAIVNNIAQAIKLFLLGKFLFRFAYGSCHTKTEA